MNRNVAEKEKKKDNRLTTRLKTIGKGMENEHNRLWVRKKRMRGNIVDAQRKKEKKDERKGERENVRSNKSNSNNLFMVALSICDDVFFFHTIGL